VKLRNAYWLVALAIAAFAISCGSTSSPAPASSPEVVHPGTASGPATSSGSPATVNPRAGDALDSRSMWLCSGDMEFTSDYGDSTPLDSDPATAIVTLIASSSNARVTVFYSGMCAATASSQAEGALTQAAASMQKNGCGSGCTRVFLQRCTNAGKPWCSVN